MVVEEKGRGPGVSPKISEKYFLSLFSSQELIEKYGEINVDLFQSRTQLDDLMKYRRITEIKVTIRKPNADILSESFLMDRLMGTNSSELELGLKANQGDVVQFDSELESASNVALQNGEISGKEIVGNRKIQFSSKDHPVRHAEEFDSEGYSDQQGFLRGARALKNIIARMFP